YQVLRRTPYVQRAAWMNKAADLMEADVDKLATMIVREMGKPITQARGEALKCVKNMRFYAGNAEAFLADEPLADPSSVNATAAWSRYEPLGVILAVMPWNFPLWQVMRFAAPALMAGNAGILKHASNVPLSALYLDSLFARGGFPEGSFSALMIPAQDVNAIIDDWRIKAVTLTGSEPAGRAVAERAGRQVKKSVLELGGSDAFIVMPSADLEQAATVAVTARIHNNGQSCIAGKRFIVHADVYDQWVPLFTQKMAALIMGDPMNEETQVGPLATKNGQKDIADLVDDAKAKGANVLLGGDMPEGPGFFYPPTIIEAITPEMRLTMEEAFGPLASVYRVESKEEAIRIANQTTFGLSSALWSTSDEDFDYFMKELDAGAVFINGMTISYPELPFGGIKDSGFGRELGVAGIREFTNLKTIWKG
ncbi:MAG: aldehyde dehydrogenase family protein, partial [Pontimonas sp.]|nr:aldehyde dehydrogenase family protein [Pontimonas sp.]